MTARDASPHALAAPSGAGSLPASPADPALRHVLSASAALRRYLLVSFLSWFPAGLTVPVMVLLMTSRGLSLAQVGTATAVYSVVIVVLELPTGGLADVAGRRVVLATSALFSVTALGLMAVASSFWPFVLASVLKGVARALSSGPAQAWYVDTLHAAEGPDADLRPGLARGEAMGSASLAVATIAGGVLPLVVPGGLVVPMIGAAVAAAVLFVVVLVAMPEPPRPRPSIMSVLRDVPVTIRSGLRLGVRDRGLSRLLLVAFALGIANSAIEIFTPGRLATLAGGVEEGSSVYSVVAAVGFGAYALGAMAAPAVSRLVKGGPGRAAVAGMFAAAAAFAFFAASAGLTGLTGIVAACGAYVVKFGTVAVADILRIAMMHRRVGSSTRATLMSVDSLQLQFGSVVGSLGLGLLASHVGLASVWWTAAVVVLASASLFVRLPGPGRHPE
ncbi:MFS transporter [Sphaerisporangium fuscum]|uniref:MFS transporter n=1 Tax=Sphaerisporangium fuscum TaxID=2835868 RepID=UPI001BDC3B52|nr:MFS transporter [Sphaerisporangium fuscum]